jgi:hypothetical protein
VVVAVVPSAASPLEAVETAEDAVTTTNTNSVVLHKAYLFKVDRETSREVEVVKVDLDVSDSSVNIVIPQERLHDRAHFHYFLVCGQEMRLEF